MRKAKFLEVALCLDIVNFDVLIGSPNKTMNTLIVTIFSLLLLSVSISSAQDPLLVKRLKEIRNDFERLSIEKRTEYVMLKQKASDANKKKKYFTCMIAIDDALNIFPDDMDLIWLRGICNAQIHDVDGAIDYYNKVIEINSNHVPTLVNLVEINFFAGRYDDAVGYIKKMNALIEFGGGVSLPILDFKYLISLVKLDEKNPGAYDDVIKNLYGLHGFMDDNPFYYYAKALSEFKLGNKEAGLIWILKAYLIFKDPQKIEIWNKALVDSGFIGAHEIMFSNAKGAE